MSKDKIISFASGKGEKRKFIQGIYDSDGSAKGCAIGNTNPEIIEIVEKLLANERFKTKRVIRKTESGKDYHILYISAGPFKDWIGGTIKS